MKSRSVTEIIVFRSLASFCWGIFKKIDGNIIKKKRFHFLGFEDI